MIWICKQSSGIFIYFYLISDEVSGIVGTSFVGLVKVFISYFNCFSFDLPGIYYIAIYVLMYNVCTDMKRILSILPTLRLQNTGLKTACILVQVILTIW